MNNDLLKVPDAIIIEDQKKIISKKAIEVGQLKALIQEKNYIIKEKNKALIELSNRKNKEIKQLKLLLNIQQSINNINTNL